VRISITGPRAACGARSSSHPDSRSLRREELLNVVLEQRSVDAASVTHSRGAMPFALDRDPALLGPVIGDALRG
jgi:hypothetical protein